MPTVLIVYAHLYDKSYNAAMLEVAKTTLEGQGHKVIVSDLYKMNFNPVMSVMDNTEGPPANAETYSYQKEMGEAYSKGTLAEDIKAEQKKLAEADLVIFQFPVQGLNMPAIMVGWTERVLTENFSFSSATGKILDFGLLNGKKALLSLTTGGAAGNYTPIGFMGDINVTLYPLQMNLHFHGLNILRPNIMNAPGHASQEERQKFLDKYAARLKTVLDEEAIFFPKLAEFRPVGGDMRRGFELPADYKRGDNAEYGATVAHHMGRKVPSES